jgi:hypothetical protein
MPSTPGIEHHLSPGFLEQPLHRRSDLRIRDDPGAADEQRSDRPHRRLALAQLLHRQPSHVRAVRAAAPLELEHPWELALMRRDDDLAADLVVDVVLVAKRDESCRTRNRELRLEAARLVVDARMDDAAVATALVPRGARFLLEHDDIGIRLGAFERKRGRQTDQAAADNGVVARAHHQSRRPAARKRRTASLSGHE